MEPYSREELGQIVRAAWVAWAMTQDNPKPHWLLPYEELSEADKEADRQIGEEVATAVLLRVVLYQHREEAQNQP